MIKEMNNTMWLIPNTNFYIRDTKKMPEAYIENSQNFQMRPLRLLGHLSILKYSEHEQDILEVSS